MAAGSPVHPDKVNGSARLPQVDDGGPGPQDRPPDAVPGPGCVCLNRKVYKLRRYKRERVSAIPCSRRSGYLNYITGAVDRIRIPKGTLFQTS